MTIEGAFVLTGLNDGLWIFGITFNGTYVKFPTLIVLIVPYLLGRIGLEMSTFKGATTTGM